ncbi:ArsR family transcriptional regulator [Ensifer sp. Root31]|uniref:ArsR/SmtB family transcription factor n=1 Tax=Ensifer sp. Root31 TaxID=1736512 RepID=UPI000710B807|nr:metalloregulator ArsR/SmtB family transcription factor [Ensifer sp. Root31]KQU86334.1 ArsR family transcriptional regulator [Ensifer sp. Root31]
MKTSDIENQFFIELAELARTLGSAQRLVLLQHVAQGERPVDRLAELSQLTIANASQHLQQLKRAGYVQARRDGKNVLYRLGNGPIIELLAALSRLAEFNQAEIRSLVSDSVYQRENLEGITGLELLERIREGGVTILDVRPEDEFTSGHLPGAINIPFDDLERRLSELPRNQEVVAYCRGSRCVLSHRAVASLKSDGIRARYLQDGFPAWKAAGLAVEARR